MDRDELVRLAGEQALLKKELSDLSTAQNADITKLRNLPNDIGHKPNWAEGGIALIRAIEQRQIDIATGFKRLGDYKRQTGLD